MTIEQKRREIFEAFASAKWPYSGQNRRDALPSGDPRYMEYVHLEMEWQAFNAALDAVDAERDQLRAEVEALRRQVDTLAEWYANSLNIISECSATLPGTTYMDPPDGGDVSIPEQMRRMAKDAERYRWLRDSSESIHQFYLSTPIWFTGVKFSKENVDSTIDAAMSKGEQP